MAAFGSATKDTDPRRRGDGSIATSVLFCRTTSPVRPETGTSKNGTSVARHPASPASPPPATLRPARGASRATASVRGGQDFDLHRSHPQLRRLRRGLHPLQRGPGVLRRKGLLVGSQALHQLPRLAAGRTGRIRGRRSLDRRPARLRARRPPGARVLRRAVLLLRQPGPGPVQAAHGPAGLLLGLLPSQQRRLSRHGRGVAADGDLCRPNRPGRLA